MLVASKKMSTKMMTKVSILGVLSFIVMFIDVPLWFTPDFLKIDLSDIPALIGAFALGPVAGVLIELVKNLLHITIKGTMTGGVGELANFIVGASFVYVAAYVYHKNKNIKNAVIGMILGTVVMTVIAGLANYFVLIPVYAKVYGAPIDYFVEITSVVNKFVVDFETFILFAVTPFNLLKGVMVTVLTLLLYKKVSPILTK